MGRFWLFRDRRRRGGVLGLGVINQNLSPASFL